MTRSTAIAYLVGARPNYVKMAPLVAQMRRQAPDRRHVLIDTGQHYDPEMSRIFVDELEIGAPDYELRIGSGTHGEQTGRAIERIEAVLAELQPEALVVPGDVNSTLAGAIAASKLGVPVAHLEAGLRSFDRTMPEEINRLLTDQLSNWCFTHSPEAIGNLEREGIAAERVFQVGNTMIDTLVKTKPAIDRSTIHGRLGVEPGGYVLVTLHRPALVDGLALPDVLASLERLSRWLPVVFPVHPRTRQRLPDRHAPEGLFLTEPVGYVDFLALETRARAVVTDSGGIQEETSYLGVPCFTMRENTERPVTVTLGTNHLIGVDPAALEVVPGQVERWEPKEAAEIPGWDGKAAERAAAILTRSVGSEPRVT
jgi:UDP-N-acetylglucosamine 2-epimerase (non-hydrolysing)